MSLEFKDLHPMFGAEVMGVDLADPASDADFPALREALDEKGVLVFHGTPMTPERQVAWAGQFGTLEGSGGHNVNIIKASETARVAPQLADISNLDEKNQVLGETDRRRMFALGNQLWHTDSSFKRIPAKYSGLHAHSVTPEGGETQIADTRAAYDALPQRMKDQIDDLVAEHSIFCSRAKLGFTDFTEEERAALPPVHRPLVRTHPASNRKAIYVASHCSHVLGMEVPDGKMLVRELIEHATQKEFIYELKWQVGDLMIWDNRCTQHKPVNDYFPAHRMLHRVVIDGDKPY